MLYSAMMTVFLSAIISFYGYSAFSARAPSLMARAEIEPLIHDLQRNSYMVCSVAGERTKADLVAGQIVSKDYGSGLFSWELDVSVSQGKSLSLIINSADPAVIDSIGAAYPSFSLPGNAEAIGLHIPAASIMNIPDLYINVANESPVINEDGCI